MIDSRGRARARLALLVLGGAMGTGPFEQAWASDVISLGHIVQKGPSPSPPHSSACFVVRGRRLRCGGAVYRLFLLLAIRLRYSGSCFDYVSTVQKAAKDGVKSL